MRDYLDTLGLRSANLHRSVFDWLALPGWLPRISVQPVIPAMSMRQLLAALVVATSLPLVTMAFVMVQQVIMQERQAFRDGLMSNARSLGALVDHEIDTDISVAATLATSPALESGDLGAFKRQVEMALMVVPAAYVNLSDPAGHVLMTTVPGVSLPTQRRGSTRLDAMAKAFATGKPQIQTSGRASSQSDRTR